MVLHNEGLYAFYYSPNIIQVFKSRILKWTGHVHSGFWWRNLREGDHLQDPGIDERIILKCIFGKWVGACTGSKLFRIGTGGGLL